MMEVLDSIPFRLDPNEVMERLHGRDEMAESVRELVEEARTVARPKAVYRISYVEDKNRDSLTIDGTRFTSRVLRINLDSVWRVFPYIATCGRELDELPIPSDDLVRAYCLDAIKRMVLTSAVGYLRDHLAGRYLPGEMSRMSPGALEDWPITQQKELFSLFGDVEGLIGVRLTESFLMVPVKSVSGVLFPSQVRFESCQLCPREVCEGRKAPYDPALAEAYGIQV